MIRLLKLSYRVKLARVALHNVFYGENLQTERYSTFNLLPTSVTSKSPDFNVSFSCLTLSVIRVASTCIFESNSAVAARSQAVNCN